MNEKIPVEVLEKWSEYVSYVAYISLIVGIIILLTHVFRLLFATESKKRYNIISLHEISYLSNSGLFLIAGGAMCVLIVAKDDITWLLLFTRVLIAIVVSVALGVSLQYVIRFYYPFFIEKRLKALRYKPRISPDGRKMKLLSEEEEDVYLDEGMQAEEEVFSVDYDVWVDEQSGYTKIEKYYGRLHAELCPECQYRTMRVAKEEIVTSPTEDKEGLLAKHTKCKYCGYEVKTEVKLAKLSKQRKRSQLAVF